MSKERIQLRVETSDLAEIDSAAGPGNRSVYMVSSSLARARGSLEVAEARVIVNAALDQYGDNGNDINLGAIADKLAPSVDAACANFTERDWNHDLEGEALADYDARVKVSAASAAEFGREAIAALRRGLDIEAMDYLERACSEESSYGDCPTWAPVREELRTALDELDAAAGGEGEES